MIHRILLKNLLATAAGQGVGAALSVATALMVARSLGVAQYGHYAYVLAFVGLFQLFASAGIEQILVRDIAVKTADAPRLLGVAKSLTWALSLVTFGLIAGAVQFTEPGPDVRLAVYVSGVGVLAVIHAAGFGSVFRAFERMEVNATAFVLHKVVNLALVAVAAWMDCGLLGMCAALALANTFLWAYYFGVLRQRHFRPRIRVDLRLWWRLLTESVPLGLAVFIRRLSWHVDILILAAFGMTAAAGYFTASYKVVQALNLIPVALAQTLFPILARTARLRSGAFEDAIHLSLRVLVCLSVPVTLGLAVSAPRLIDLAYGPAFAPATVPLAVTSLSLPFIFWTSLYPFLFIALGAQRYCTMGALAGLLVNAAVDVVLVPHLAEVGASIGTLSGEVALFAVDSFLLARLQPGVRLLGLAWRPLLAGAGMAVILYAVHDAALVVFVAGVVGALGVYGALLMALRAVTPAELATVSSEIREGLRFRFERETA